MYGKVGVKKSIYTFVHGRVCVFDLRGERREKKYSKEVILRGCEYALKYYEAFVRVYNLDFYHHYNELNIY